MNNEWVDRYGRHYPDPATVCKGQCEGMRCYPKKIKGLHKFIRNLSGKDDWVFVKCEHCNGTGREPTQAAKEGKDGILD